MRGQDFNKNWKFQVTDAVEDLHKLSFDDSQWLGVNLPYDWSAHTSCNEEKGEGCTAYFLGGNGWYRKTFVTTNEMEGNKVLIQFDGIYNRSSIYCNGEYIKFHPYGYSPCVVDVSEYLRAEGEENLIAVHVDHTRYADSRWYTGSGIYRNVTMHVIPAIAVPLWGIAISTQEVVDDVATVLMNVDVNNSTDSVQTAALKIVIKSPINTEVLKIMKEVEIKAGDTEKCYVEMKVEQPILWGVFQGNQYTATVEVLVNGVVVQTNIEKFGIRTFRFDADKGFYINGENTLIKGVCLHHDVGCVGAAVPLAVWKRRLLKLIECGTNAIRTAHNPFAEDFFELCDELGLLVQEEFYDEWDYPKDKRHNGTEVVVDYITRAHTEYFREYAKEDLQNIVKRDMNRACIIQWSIGNEIEWTYTKYNDATGYFGPDKEHHFFFWSLPLNTKEEIKENVAKIPKGKFEVADMAHLLAEWTKEIDTTRPVTANCILPSVSYETGFTDELDVVGYSYRRVIYEYGHENYPEKPILGTENWGQWHDWKAVLDNEHVSGMFIWTGVDYLGEASKRGPFPIKGTKSGLLDLASFEKPSFYMFQSLWTEEPRVYIATQSVEKSLYKMNNDGELYAEDADEWKSRTWVWQEVNEHWNYENHETIAVEVYSNCEEVTLYLNGKALATKYLKDFEDHIYKWAVPFKMGTLKAIGKQEDIEVVYEIHTAEEMNSIVLTVDKDSITTDVDDAVHVVAQLVDKSGNPITHEDRELQFDVEGDYILLGIDNGRVNSVQDHKATKIVTSKGRCLFILQSQNVGEIDIKAVSEGITSNVIQIQVVE